MYEHCRGAGRLPVKTIPGSDYGRCQACGRRTKLTSAGRVRAHAPLGGQVKGPMDIRSTLCASDQEVYDRVADLLGPPGTQALEELADAIFQAGQLYVS